MRFLGNIEAKTDAKGRAFLPAVMRKVLQSAGEERLVLRRDVFQPCLVLYPESVWNEQMDTLRRRLSRWNREHQDIYRRFVAEAETVVLDGSGRFLIPRRCQQQAAIRQDIRFVGMGDTIEIWASGAADDALGQTPSLGPALERLMGQASDAEGSSGCVFGSEE
ncbi:MAG: division/cell wall cluster transcriptional repressor MraZ [Prevotella sp.]|nr:division/cell wall cluster transcriptional repressor MraZ [Prevotella sp.]